MSDRDVSAQRRPVRYSIDCGLSNECNVWPLPSDRIYTAALSANILDHFSLRVNAAAHWTSLNDRKTVLKYIPRSHTASNHNYLPVLCSHWLQPRPCIQYTVYCLCVLTNITRRPIYSGDQLWWTIPSGSLPLYCYNVQLLLYCGKIKYLWMHFIECFFTCTRCTYAKTEACEVHTPKSHFLLIFSSCMSLIKSKSYTRN